MKTAIRNCGLGLLLQIFFLLQINFVSAQSPLSASTDPVCTSKCCQFTQPCSCSAGVIVTGGVPPYSYFVMPLGGSFPVGFTACVTGLCPGTYNFHIRDAANTQIVHSVTIGGPCCQLNCRDTSFCFNVPDTAIHLKKPTYTGSDAVSPGTFPCAYDSIWNNAPFVYPVGTTVVTWYVLHNGVIDSCTSNVIRNPPSNYSICFNTSPPVVGGVINICNGQSITFNANCSSGITGVLWNFGNGYYSGNSVHTEPASHYPPGVYYDTLTVYDDCGTPHDTAFMVVVDSSSGPDIFCQSVQCPGDTVTYHTSANCTGYTWSVTGGTFLFPPSSTSDSCVVVWGAGPTGTITLNVTNCTPALTCPLGTTVTIHIVPATLPVSGDTVVCSGGKSCYAVECIPGNTHTWELLPANAGVLTGNGTCEVCIEWDTTFFGPVTLQVIYNNVLTGSGCSLQEGCVNDPGCGGTGTIHINVKPNFGISGPVKLCPNVATATPFNGMNLTNNTIAPGVTWKVVTPAPSTLFFASSGALNAYTWNAGAGVYTLTAYPPAGVYCNDSAIVTVTVVDMLQPVAIVGLDTVCANTPSFYSTAPNMTGVTYTWTVSGGTIIGPATGSSVSISWNPGGGTVSVIQTLNGPPGCSSVSSAIKNVATWPAFTLPIVSASSSNVCVKSTVTYSIPTPLLSNAAYTWSVVPPTAGNILSANGADSIVINWIDATNTPIFVKLKISRCYDDSVMFPVNLLALPPVPDISYTPLNPCKNTVVNFSTLSTGPVYSWDFGDAGTSSLQNPNHIYTSAGDFNVQLAVTNTNGCSDTAVTSIHVDDVPVVPVISGPSDICVNSATSHTFSQPLFTGANYTWSLSAPALGGITSSGNSFINVMWSVPGTDTIKLHVQSACLDTTVFYVVTVHALPVPTVGLPSPACEGAPLTFTGTGGGTYSWSFAGASPSFSNLANPVVTYAVSNNYPLSLTVTDTFGCSATVNTSLTVNPLPLAIISGPAGVCTYPTSVTMTAVNIGGYSFVWTPTGSTNASITYNVTSPTTFSCVVTNSFGCTRTSNAITITSGLCDTVRGPCIVNDSIDFTYTPPICLSQTYTKIYSAPLIGWNFGDGGSAGPVSPVSHNFPYPGIYPVQVIGQATGVDSAGNPCTILIGKTRMMTIPFDAKFKVNFQCNGLNQMQTIFTNTTLYIGNPLSYNWTWTDYTTATTLSTSAFPTPQNLSAGTHVIGLSIFDPATGATCTVTDTFNVPAPIVASFTVSSPVCQGTPATFTDTSTPLVNEISRLFNNGNAATSASSPANLVYINSGNFNATLTVTDKYGCTSTASQNVFVNPSATGTITVTPACDSVQLFSSGAGPYTWNVLSTPPFANPVYVTTSGFYSVTSVDGNGCPFTVGPVQVTVQKSPNATITGQIQYCQGENLDIKTSAAGTNFSWVLLPSTPVGGNTPNLTVLAGQGNSGTFTYQVTVTGLNGCTAVATYTINVDPVPASASIVGGPLTFCEGDSVLLTVNPPGNTYLWSKSPSPALSAPANANDSLYVSETGTYSVIVTTINGCQYPAISPVNVTVNPASIANITGDTVICEGEALALNTTPVGGATYAWTGPYGTQNTQNYFAANMQLFHAGYYTVTVTNSYGCTKSDSVAVVVNPAPVTPVILPGGVLCEGLLYNLCIQSPMGFPIVYNWNTGQMSTCISVAKAGDYYVTATNQFGCTAQSNIITIHPKPDLSCVPTGCYDFCTECDSVTIPGPFNLALYDWQILVAGNWTSYSNTQNLVVYPPGGIFRLVAANQWGCADSTDTLKIDFHDCCQPVDTSCAALCHVNAGNDTIVCAGTVVTLQATGCDSIPQWYEITPVGLQFVGQGPIVDVIPNVNTCYAVICCCPNTGCCDTDTVCINVYMKPKLIWTQFPSVCQNSGPVLLDTAAISIYINNTWIPVSQAGGTGVFSGPFVTGNIFTPSTIGFYTITYSYTDTNGCSGSVSATINVVFCCDSTSCHVDAGPDQTICAGDAAILTANGCTGTAQWFKMTATGGAVPIGQGPILDIMPTQNTCYMVICCCPGQDPTTLCCDTDIVCINVYPKPQLIWNAQFPSVCQNSGPVLLDTAAISIYINNTWIPVSQAGGTGVFSGPFVTGNIFTPSTIGFYTITYSYTDTNGCSGSVSATINVVFCCDSTSCHVDAGPDQTICAGDAAILTANGCTGIAQWYQLTQEGPVQVGQGPEIDVMPLQNTCYMVICCCPGQDPTTLCCDTDIVCINVNPKPVLQWPFVFDDVCLNGDSVYINPYSIFVDINQTMVMMPFAGGTWTITGPGVTGNYFYPSTLGPNVITVCYTDQNGCTTCISKTINVIYCCGQSCHVNAGNDTTICAGSSVNLQASGCNGSVTWYTLSGHEALPFSNEPSITVTPQQSTCYMVICCCQGPVICCDTDTVCINIQQPLQPQWLSGFEPLCVNGAPFYLDEGNIFVTINNQLTPVTMLAGSGVFSGPNVSGNYFYPVAAGVFTVTYTYTDSYGCVSTTTFTITVVNCGCGPCYKPGPELLQNPGFETSAPGFISQLTNSCSCTTGTWCVATNAQLKCAANNSVVSTTTPTGNRFLIIDGHASLPRTVWRQNVVINPLQNYIFSFWVHPKVSSQTVKPDLQVKVGSTVMMTLPGVALPNTWTKYSVVISGMSATFVEINQTNSGAAGNDYGFDDMSLKRCIKSVVVVLDPHHVKCHGGNDGAITAQVLDGEPPYQFVWSDGQSSQDISGLVAGTYTLTVIDHFGCNEIISATIDEPAPLNPGPVSGTYISACLPAVSSGGSYSIPAIQGAAYTWSLPNGMSILSGQGTNSLFATWTGSAVNSGIVGDVCVAVTDSCGTVVSCQRVDINAVKPVTPPSISGPSKVCPGDMATYSIAAVPRAAGYIWTLPSGMTITSGAGTNVITVSVGSSYTGGTISVVAFNACGNSPARTKVVQLNPPSVPGVISGLAGGVCGESNVIYSIAAVPNALSYQWSVTNGVIVGPSNGTSVSIDWNSSFTTGVVSVSAINGCGASALRTLNVSGAPLVPGTISGPVSVCTGGTYHYQVPTVNGAMNYIWTSPGTIVNGQGTKEIDVQYGSVTFSGQTITVKASNNCGTGATRILSGINSAFCIRTGEISDKFSVYPNPASSEINIEFNAECRCNYTAELTDMTGRVIYIIESIASEGNNRIILPVDEISEGVYFVRFKLNDQLNIVKVTIEK